MGKKLLSLTLTLLCIISCLSLAGCGENKKDSAGVYFLNFKPESAPIYEELAKKYKEEKGVEVKVVTAAANTYEQTLKSEIAKTDAPTIFQVNGPIGYNAWKEYCLDIKGSKLYSYLSDKNLAITDGDGVYAVPYVVEGYGIIYNDAIMKKYFAWHLSLRCFSLRAASPRMTGSRALFLRKTQNRRKPPKGLKLRRRRKMQNRRNRQMRLKKTALN